MFVVIRAFRNRCRHFIPLCPTPQQNRPQFLPHRPPSFPSTSAPFSSTGVRSQSYFAQNKKAEHNILCSALRERCKKLVGESGKKFCRMRPNSEKTSANVTNMWAREAAASKSKQNRIVQRQKGAPYIVANENRPFPRGHRAWGLCTGMGRKVFLANMGAADVRVDLRG